MASELEIKSFLKQLHAHIKIFDIFFVDRSKNNLQDLLDLEITALSRKEIIMDLIHLDYSEGPIPDTQYGGIEYWVFGKEIKGCEIYIKVTINTKTSKPICISFHQSEHTMQYPLKS